MSMQDLIKRAEMEEARNWRPPQGYIQRSSPAATQAFMAAGVRGGQGLAPRLAAVKNPVQQAQVQQSQAADNSELLRAILELRALFAKQVAADQRKQAQVNRAQYRPHLSGQGYQQTQASGYQDPQAVYSVRDAVRRSVGLPPERQQPAPALPISPQTGKPSALRAMIERSVGMRG